MPKRFASYDKYLSDFTGFEADLPAREPAWLQDTRRRGLAAFDRLKFPTAVRGNEKWKYTSVGPIAQATFEYPFESRTDGIGGSLQRDLLPWDESWTRLVFVDGRYRDALSSVRPAGNGMQAANLADVVREDGNLVSNHLASHAIVEDDGFTAVNTAFLRDGAYVRVPEGSSPESTLHLIFVTTERPQPIVSYPRTLVLVGKHGRLTVVESYVSQSQAPYFTNAVTEMVVSEGAQVEHYRYLMESPGAFHVGTTRVYQERDSTFNSTSFATGSRLARNDLQVLLDGPGSSCTVNGLYVTSGTQHIDNHIDIDHAQPHTTSNQYFKGILGGQSRAVFSGRVVVRRDAQKANARQSDKNLILSEGARVNTKPSLEIFADDVQCAHGATAGAVADDALFYMRSRGLDEEAARRLLVYGFASEIIDTVRLGPLRQHLEGMFSGKAQAAGRVTGS